MSTIERPIPVLSAIHWRLPLGFIAATHLLFPALLLWIMPAAARAPEGWIGAILFSAQLFCLLYTSTVLSLRMTPVRGIETGLVALTISLCFTAAIVSYLGLAGLLSLTNLL